MPTIVPRICGAGIACVDHLFTSPPPAWGDTAHATGYCVQGGGLVGTALVAAARLGGRAEIVSLLGDDAAGDAILRGLRAERVGVSRVLRVPGGGSPFSFIHVAEGTGERTIFHRRALGLDAAARRADFSAIDRADVLLVDDYYPALARAAARRARAKSVPVVADFVPWAKTRELARHVDVLIAPKHFVVGGGFGPRSAGDRGRKAPPTQAALDAIHALGPRTAVITLGADGGVWSDATGRGSWRGFRVKAVDTTGAGDVFHGAFAYGLARGWDTPRCCRFAAAVAAIKCAKPGGRTGIPTLQTTLTFLKRQVTEWNAQFPKDQ